MESQGTDEEEAAMVLGANSWQMFFRVTLPNIKWGLLYGVVLCTARALGEFGATVMVLGIRDSTRTLPIFVYDEFEDLNPAGVVPAVLLLLAVTLVVIVLYNRLFVRGPKKL